MKRLVKMGVSLAAGIALTDALADLPAVIDAEALNEPGSAGEVFAEGCNRALHMRITEWAVLEDHAGEAPPPGHHWLALDLEVENRMPADLIFDLDYEEAVLIGSLARQGYLLVNGQRVSRRALLDSDSRAIEDGFVLGRIGEVRTGRVVYPIPETQLESLSFHYYHDDYAPLAISLLGEIPTESEGMPVEDMEVQRNDLMKVAVFSVDHPDTLHGQAPPEGMRWLAVDLRGRSLWENPADALALNRDAEIDERVSLPHVMEYVEAGGLLQVVVDHGHGYVRHTELSSLLEDPAWLPDAMAGGIAVFPVPEDAGDIELVTYFPEFRADGISSEIRPPLRFRLREGGVSKTDDVPLALIEDDPTPLSLHALEYRDRFAGHQAEEGEVLLLVEASMTNLSGVGGMMGVSQRLRPLAPAGELVAVYQRGPIELEEPFWLPANDEPRHFMLLYRFKEPAESQEFEYRGVSVNQQVSLPVEN